MEKLKHYAREIVRKPDLYDRFLEKFTSYGPFVENYMKQKSILISSLCKENGMSIRAPRWYPNDFRKQNYKAAEFLLNQFYSFQIKGIQKKKLLWAAQGIQNLSESLGSLAAKNALDEQPFLNSKILGMIKPFIEKPTTLDDFF